MKNTIYMAPMEGLTDFTFRNAYEKIFGKGKIAKYFTPFISPNKSEKFLAREIRDIDREHNNGINTVVQVMTMMQKILSGLPGCFMMSTVIMR